MKLGHYEIVKCIGTTELTMLYLAIHPYLKKDLVIEASATKDENIEERLKFLASLLGQLQHPKILPIVDAFEDGQTMYLVFEWPKQKLMSLDARQKRTGAFSLDEVLRYTLSICEVLEYLEQKNIVHQNLKLEYITVSDSHFYIGGFNIANTTVDPFEEKRQALEDARYASPEWLMRSPLTHKQDIWSLGVCMYKMLTNHFPFQGCEKKTTGAKIIEDEPTPISEFAPDIPQCIDDLITKILSKNAEKRPALQEIVEVVTGQLYQTPVASAFIAMPFHPQFNRVYTSIKNVCQKCRIRPVRVDENLLPSNIWQEIEQGIKEAAFVVGDISPVPGFNQTNPNVAFEVGIAYNLHKPTILLTQDIEKLPFDFKQQRVHSYKNDNEDLNKFEETFEKVIKEVLNSTM